MLDAEWPFRIWFEIHRVELNVNLIFMAAGTYIVLSAAAGTAMLF